MLKNLVLNTISKKVLLPAPETKLVLLQVRHSRYDPMYLDPIFRKEDLNKPLAENDPLRFQPIKAAKNEQTCSLNYDPLIEKFKRYLIKAGDKETASKVLNKSFEHIKYYQLEKYHKAESEEERESIETNPHTIFHEAVKNCKPILLPREVARGGIAYQVPTPLTPNYQTHKSFRWIIEGAMRKQMTTKVWISLANELISASKHEGRAIRSKLEAHRICEENKAYTHFRR